MIYRIINEHYEAVQNDGEIITFDDAAEMIRYAEARAEIFRLVGKTVVNIDQLKKLFAPSEPISKIKPKKKKIRINIDPDPEYVGKEKALA